MNLEEINARLAAIETERRTIHEAAGDAALTEEQQTRWDALDTEETDLHAQRAEIEAEDRRRAEADERLRRVQESRARWGSTRFGGRVEPFDGADVTRLDRGAVRDRALAVLDSRDHADHLSDEQRTRLERVLRTRDRNVDGAQIGRRLLLTENEHYREAFMRLVTRTSPVLSPEQSRAVQAFEEYRAMNIGTDTDGGFGVPVLIDPTIILTAQGSPNDFFNLARVETITTDKWRGVSSAGMSWSFKAESAPATDGSPSLDQPVVTAHRADGYIPYSIEVGMDYPGFAGEMATLLAEGYSELLVQKFTTGAGDGSEEPFGIVTALNGTASEIDLAATGVIDADAVNGLWAALPIRYRRPMAGAASTAWMSSTDVNNVIQQLGASNNNSAFTVDFTAEGVLVLKGRNAYLNDYLPVLGGAKDGLLVVGDWRNYLIAQRAGMSVELVPHVFNAPDTGGAVVPNGERAWFAWARVGADSINDNAFRMASDDGL